MPTTERILDLLVESRPYEPDGPTYLSLRLSGVAVGPSVLALSVQIPGPRRELIIRTWDDLDPVIGGIARHPYGLMAGPSGATHTAHLRWSPAFQITLLDGARFPPGTHVELYAAHQTASP